MVRPNNDNLFVHKWTHFIKLKKFLVSSWKYKQLTFPNLNHKKQHIIAKYELKLNK